MHAFHRTIIATILMLALQLVALSSWAFAQVPIPIDFPGAVGTAVSGVNDAGAIVGEYTDRSGITHGFLWQGGSFTPIDFPGAVDTAVNGINDAGAIVGEYTDRSGTGHGFIVIP
jgi:probable HAF family extracellular repeat protein